MRIQFGISNGQSRIEKDEKGTEHRYLEGTSSGSLFIDAHNERMSERCIKGFQQQAEEKTIYLLHPHTNDLLTNHIGILISDKSFVDNMNEWKTVFKIWSNNDLNNGIPKSNIDRANDFWNMITGNGVYKKPTAIKQFSVQGLVDETKDIRHEGNIRIIDWVDLDGVSVITKGAYPQDDFTVAQKIFKQLDIKQIGILKNKIQKSENMEDFYISEMKLEDKYNDVKNEILFNDNLNNDEKKEQLIALLDEYREMSIKNLELINYSIEGDEVMKRKVKNLDEDIDSLTENAEPEVINKEDEVEKEEQDEAGEQVMVPVDVLEELVEKVIAKLTAKTNEDVMKDTDSDGISDENPEVLKEEDENVEKEETEDVEKEYDEEKELDEDIEKVSKKLGLSKSQKQELYDKKSLRNLPKSFLKQLAISNNEVIKLKKQIAYLSAGQEAIISVFTEKEQQPVNKVNKSVKQEKISTIANLEQSNKKGNFNSFQNLRKFLGGE